MSKQRVYELILQTSRLNLTLKQFLKLKFHITDDAFDRTGFSEEDIINYKFTPKTDDDQPAINNAFKIFSKYTDEQRNNASFDNIDDPENIQFSAGTIEEFADIIIRYGTQIALPQEFLNLTRSSFFDSAVVFPFKEFRAFIGDEILKIIKDEGYESKFKPDNQSPKAGILKKHEKISVQVYSKALGGEMIDLTPFIISCNTSVTKTGGNFSIELPPITAELIRPQPKKRKQEPLIPSGGVGVDIPFDRTPRWVIKENSLVTFGDGEYAFKDNMFLTGDDGLSHQNNYYFMNVIQPNDVILIKFEELQMEEKGKVKRSDLSEFITLQDAKFLKSQVGGKRRKQGTVKGTSDDTLATAINGQVLDMIALVDRVSISQQPASANVSINVSGRDMVKMIIEDGSIFFPGAADESLEGVLKYRSSYFLNPQVAIKSPSFKRLFSVRRIEGEIQDVSLFLFQSVNFWLNYVLTKLSTSRVILENEIYGLQKTDADVKQNVDTSAKAGDNKSDVERVGLWRLVRILVDPQIQNRQLADSSIASDSGSLINFINKFCQEPFIEFWTDTYGDRFYWIARKPPWTREAFLENHTQDIDDVDLLNVSLAFDDTQTYSWYRISPQVFYEGDSENSAFYHPAVFLPKFAELYGARALDIKSAYIEYDANAGMNDAGYKQGVEDLRWLIQTHAHLVFTRKGTITINRDRKIKRGMNVYLKSSDELFYVESVSHTYNTTKSSVDGVTTLQVSRGIVRTHENRYFNLVDTSTAFITETQEAQKIEKVEKSDLKTPEEGVPQEIKEIQVIERRVYDWDVVESNFNFLQRREQFE